MVMDSKVNKVRNHPAQGLIASHLEEPLIVRGVEL
jgi:hypothetical protein